MEIVKEIGNIQIADNDGVIELRINNDVKCTWDGDGNMILKATALLSVDKLAVNATSGVAEKLYVKGDSRFQGGMIFAGTTSYLQVPSLTTTQRDALTPSNGMIIYNTSDNALQAYVNSAWVSVNVSII